VIELFFFFLKILILIPNKTQILLPFKKLNPLTGIGRGAESEEKEFSFHFISISPAIKGG
jgi:hypothetical protein